MRHATSSTPGSALARWRPGAPLPRSTASELLDEPGIDAGELRENFRDIRRVNRFFGGTSTVLAHFPGLIASVPAKRTITVLDLATGSADIPLALGRWAAANGRSLAITASDVSEEILAEAERHIRGQAGIGLKPLDARRVDGPDESYDVVVCSLALHHFAPADAVLVLREMRRVCRVGFIVNDLCRSRTGYAAAWVAAHATTRNRLTRHDAPLSVLRAYSLEELRGLLAEAGIVGATARTHAWFRMAAVWRAGAPDA